MPALADGLGRLPGFVLPYGVRRSRSINLLSTEAPMIMADTAQLHYTCLFRSYKSLESIVQCYL